MDNIVNRAYHRAKERIGKGKVSSYIPQLAKANSQNLGVSLTDLSGNTFSAGDSKSKFTIQSISKIISLALVLEELGSEKVFSFVGMESSGDGFNSMLRLETNHNGKPSNPMVNSGAIAICAAIQGDNSCERFGKILALAKKLAGTDQLAIDNQVYTSESLTGDRNRAMAYMMKSSGVFGGNIDEHLEVYFKACSILMSAEELSYMGAVLANDGCNLKTGEPIISKKTAQIVKAMMIVAGMYDASGEFLVDVGFPAKSGVGGGIVGAVKEKIGIGVFSPALDEKGNSLAGTAALNYLADELDLKIY